MCLCASPKLQVSTHKFCHIQGVRGQRVTWGLGLDCSDEGFLYVWKLEGLQGVCDVDQPPPPSTEFNVFTGQIGTSCTRMSDLNFGFNLSWRDVWLSTSYMCILTLRPGLSLYLDQMQWWHKILHTSNWMTSNHHILYQYMCLVTGCQHYILCTAKLFSLPVQTWCGRCSCTVGVKCSSTSMVRLNNPI